MTSTFARPSAPATTPRTGAPRLDLYAPIHKALRHAMGETLARVGRMDVADAQDRADALVAVDEALTRLAVVDERLSRVVECRFFGGLTEEETATALRVTARTVRRDWVKAKGWLYQELHDVA